MSEKGRIRTYGIFNGGSPDDEDRNFRQAVIEQQWHNFKVTNDLECLAQICEHADYFGNGDVGPVIAREIRSRSRRAKGYEVDRLWEEACRMYERLPFDPDWKDASKDAQRRHIGGQMGIPKNRAIVALLGGDIENLEQWSERFRKQLAKRRPTK